MEPDKRRTKWSATFYEGEYHYFDNMPSVVKSYGYQDEVCPTTGKKHRQAWLLTAQQSFRAIQKKIPGVHLKPVLTDEHWDNLKDYCKKARTRDLSGNVVEEVKNSNYLRQSDIYMLVASKVQGYITPERIAECVRLRQDINREEFWYGVNGILFERPELSNFLSAPASEKFWMRTGHTWKILYNKSISNATPFL